MWSGKFALFVQILLLFCANSLLAQDTTVRAGIVNALATGNATQLSAYFDAAVDLIVPQNEGNFSKKQATQIMKFFFDRNPPEEFLLEHEDMTNDGSTYFIGYYKTTAGKTLRTYILMKKLEENEFIRQLQMVEK